MKNQKAWSFHKHTKPKIIQRRPTFTKNVNFWTKSLFWKAQSNFFAFQKANSTTVHRFLLRYLRFAAEQKKQQQHISEKVTFQSRSIPTQKRFLQSKIFAPAHLSNRIPRSLFSPEGWKFGAFKAFCPHNPKCDDSRRWTMVSALVLGSVVKTNAEDS